MYNTTGSPEPKGKCPKCGYETFLGLFHMCSTAPKPQAFGFKIETRDWLKENEWYLLNEITSEDRKKVYNKLYGII